MADNDGLTPCEKQILALLADGWSNKVIAGLLGWAPNTLSKQVSILYEKLNLPQERNRRVSAARQYWRETKKQPVKLG